MCKHGTIILKPPVAKRWCSAAPNLERSARPIVSQSHQDPTLISSRAMLTVGAECRLIHTVEQQYSCIGYPDDRHHGESLSQSGTMKKRNFPLWDPRSCLHLVTARNFNWLHQSGINSTEIFSGKLIHRLFELVFLGVRTPDKSS